MDTLEQHQPALGSRTEQKGEGHIKPPYDKEKNADDEIRRAFGAAETNKTGGTKKQGVIMSIEEYRKAQRDFTSKDEKIVERIKFMEALCRNVVRIELEKMRAAYRVRK